MHRGFLKDLLLAAPVLSLCCLALVAQAKWPTAWCFQVDAGHSLRVFPWGGSFVP